MIKEGIDRETTIREIISQVGGAVEHVYWLFGQHDLMAVFEIPDDVDAMAVRNVAYSSGHLRHIEFHLVIDGSSNAPMQHLARELSQVFKDPNHPEAPRHGDTPGEPVSAQSR
jgi:hypothetical protein